MNPFGFCLGNADEIGPQEKPFVGVGDGVSLSYAPPLENAP